MRGDFKLRCNNLRMLAGVETRPLIPSIRDSEIYSCLSLEGNWNSILRYLSSWITLRPRSYRYLFVSNQAEVEKNIKTILSNHIDQIEFLNYSDLVINNGRTVSGYSLILLFPIGALENSPFVGRVDGGLIRVILPRLWKNLVVTREVDVALGVHRSNNPESTLRSVSLSLRAMDDSTSWLNELLLTLLYKRHPTMTKLMKEIKSSLWWQANQSIEGQIRDTLNVLQKLRVIQERKGRLTCSEYGRLLIERDIPLKEFDMNTIDQILERERLFGERERPIDVFPDAQIKDAIIDSVSQGNWTSVHNMVWKIRREHPDLHVSPASVRRLVEGLTEKGVLVKGVYNRGIGRPINIYYEHGNEPAWLENECGGCAFYIRSLRRCRLWWAANRFGGNLIHGRWDQLSPMAREKLRYGITRMGPKSTACEHYAPRKRDYPIKIAKERCLGCGEQIELQLVKRVICTNCGTEYKPVRDKILVLYNYEHIFRKEYYEIVGEQPPSSALVSSDDNVTTQEKDVIILYPDEQVALSESGIRVVKRGLESFQRYDQIYHIVDYGALTTIQGDLLRKKGIHVAQRILQAVRNRNPVRSEITTNLKKLRDDDKFTRILEESLILSVIIASKRNLELLGTRLWSEPIDMQLIEHTRMKQLETLSLDTFLGFEARVNYQYWRVFKSRLKMVGLEFQSRVRDRFVRELVWNARGRARGYSPVNSAINYLHQRRLARCGRINSNLGLTESEGFLHVAARRQGIGLLLDLSEPFKLADREKLLEVCLQGRITREDFISMVGRQRTRFYYPSSDAIEKLEKVGGDADQLTVSYNGKAIALEAAYVEYASSINETLTTLNVERFSPFIFGTQTETEWVKGKLKQFEA